MFVLGIDPGTTTGLAVWDTKAQVLVRVESTGIIYALRRVEQLAHGQVKGGQVGFVIVEDARKRGSFGKIDEEIAKYGGGVREGAGAAKREAAIWEEFLEILAVDFIMRRPVRTKGDAATFERLTGWTERTNQHSRDAGMIVYGLNDGNISSLRTTRDFERETAAAKAEAKKARRRRA